MTVLEDERPLQLAMIATSATISEGETSTITLRALEPMPTDVTVTVITYSDAVAFSENTVLMIAEGQTASTGVVTVAAVHDEDMRNEGRDAVRLGQLRRADLRPR